MTDKSLRGPDGRVLFSEAELRCKGSGMLILAQGFGEALVKLRLALGQPMTVNSACRSAAHNRRVGGHERSLHVCDKPHWPTGGCCAIDIAMRDGSYNLRLLGLAERQGWAVGINFAKKFIHIDRRADFLIGQPSLFPY